MKNSFNITFSNQLITINPLDDGSFDVYNASNRLGNLIPIILDDLTIKWTTSDLIEEQYAQQIGEMIENIER